MAAGAHTCASGHVGDARMASANEQTSTPDSTHKPASTQAQTAATATKCGPGSSARVCRHHAPRTISEVARSLQKLAHSADVNQRSIVSSWRAGQRRARRCRGRFNLFALPIRGRRLIPVRVG